MSKKPPVSIPILHDDYHAEHIGTTADGRQFFLTTPFEAAREGNAGCEFVALYTFDAKGNLLEALIDSFGPRSGMDTQGRSRLLEQRLTELGEKTFGDIRVKPFSVNRFGTDFGLIPEAPEDDDDAWWVIVLPGDYMAFTEPWDGTYDT